MDLIDVDVFESMITPPLVRYAENYLDKLLSLPEYILEDCYIDPLRMKKRFRKLYRKWVDYTKDIYPL